MQSKHLHVVTLHPKCDMTRGDVIATSGVDSQSAENLLHFGSRGNASVQLQKLVERQVWRLETLTLKRNNTILQYNTLKVQYVNRIMWFMNLVFDNFWQEILCNPTTIVFVDRENLRNAKMIQKHNYFRNFQNAKTCKWGIRTFWQESSHRRSVWGASSRLCRAEQEDKRCAIAGRGRSETNARSIPAKASAVWRAAWCERNQANDLQCKQQTRSWR